MCLLKTHLPYIYHYEINDHVYFTHNIYRNPGPLMSVVLEAGTQKFAIAVTGC